MTPLISDRYMDGTIGCRSGRVHDPTACGEVESETEKRLVRGEITVLEVPGMGQTKSKVEGGVCRRMPGLIRAVNGARNLRKSAISRYATHKKQRNIILKQRLINNRRSSLGDGLRCRINKNQEYNMLGFAFSRWQEQHMMQVCMCGGHPALSRIASLSIAVAFIFLPMMANAQEMSTNSITNRFGDSIRIPENIPDSTYKPGEILIKFLADAIDTDLLCYNGALVDSMYPALFSQRFEIDEIVLSPALRDAIKGYGGLRLRRLTLSSPCVDTISIARNGDTLMSEDYLYMLLEVAQGEIEIPQIAHDLTYYYYGEIELAEPNYIYDILTSVPNDPDYVSGLFPNSQWNMKNIGMEDAWDYQTGDYRIKLSIIDTGVDYHHADLGVAWGYGYKIGFGYNYTENNFNFDTESEHGTMAAGVAAGLTNNELYCSGIAGGWGAANIGCQIHAYRTAVVGDNLHIELAFAISAIRMAVSNAPGGYGKATDIINLSWGNEIYSENLQAALNYAFEHGVTVVCSRGNIDGTVRIYPACMNPDQVVTVGAADEMKNRYFGLSYGYGMDIIAPTDFLAIEPNGVNLFTGTSASAPQAAGVAALVRSQGVKYGGWWSRLVPEDYDGMLKASAIDRNPSTDANEADYLYGYDYKTGWGHLHAGNVLSMTINNPSNVSANYQVEHYTSDDLTFGPWSALRKVVFHNDGNTSKYSKLLPNGIYIVRSREASGTLSLDPARWDFSAPVYVWGIAEPGGGLGLDNPNYQVPLTLVTSGQGNTIQGANEQPGILHQHSTVVAAKTWQYEVYSITGRYIGLLPLHPKINISTFARNLTPLTAVDEDIYYPAGDALHIEVAPQPATDAIAVSVIDRNGNYTSDGDLYILDVLGRELINVGSASPHIYLRRIDIARLSSGLYFVKYVSRVGVSIEPLLVRR